MKIAISVPDPISRAADRTAKQLRVPRSQFYTRAVQAYLKQTSADDITTQLDAVYSTGAQEEDAFLATVARATFRRQR
jgi:hypothetical protein